MKHKTEKQPKFFPSYAPDSHQCQNAIYWRTSISIRWPVHYIGIQTTPNQE